MYGTNRASTYAYANNNIKIDANARTSAQAFRASKFAMLLL